MMPRLRWGTLSSRPLLVIGIVLPIVIFVAAGWYDYTAERASVREAVRSTNAALSEHGQKVVETSDLVLARVLDRTSGMDWATIQTSATLHAFISDLREQLPQLESIFIVAPDGRSVANSREFPLNMRAELTEREYMRHARAGYVGTYFTEPYTSRIDGRKTFSAQRVRLTNGKFDGIVSATISPSYLHDVYAAVIEFPGHSTATLTRADGTILFRYPHAPALADKLPASSPFYQIVADGSNHGLIDGRSSIDGRGRIWAYRRLSNNGLYVSFSIDNYVYLSAWWLNLVLIGAFCGLLSAALLLTERVIMRRTAAEIEASRVLLGEVQRRQTAELALEQSHKMEALGRLTGGVAHDFNNLLTAIMGPLELASKRSSDPRVLRLLTGAMQAAQRGATLTAQMLAVARKRDLAVQPVDLNTALRAMGDMIARTIGPAVRVIYRLDPGATAVAVNQVHMEVTLLNLSLNARDAMPQGGDLVLQTERLAALAQPGGLPPGDYVRISVSDTGEGMTEEVRARALEPFFTTKEPGKGTGLGLSTAYGFAQSVGGTIDITSMPGAGTTVSVTLPRVEAVVAPSPTGPSQQPGQPIRILLVDDDDAVRLAVRESLEDLGHKVVDTDGGREALKILADDSAFDLLTTDFAMADMDGAALAEAVRGLFPTMPILFVTGYVKNDALTVWQGRNTHCLDKPFTAQDLARAVELSMAQQPSVRAAS